MPPPPASETSATGTTAGRPTGITILAILAAISGVFGILGSIALIGGGAFIGAQTGNAALGGLAAVVGAILLISSILSLLFAWGAWGLQAWAWTLGVVLQAVSIVLGLFQLINGNFGAVISIAIAGAITYYLFTPGVQRAFGRA